MENEDKYFRTNNFYLACFLYSKGLVLVNLDTTKSSTRAEFVFLESTEREALLHSFNFAKDESPDVLVDSRKFVLAIRTLKDKLYQTNYK